MGLTSVLAYARKLVEDRLRPGEPVVDATAGTGVDTLFLARISGARGTVYAFDIQEKALQRTAERLAGEQELAEVHLLYMSHHRMEEVLPAEHKGKLAAVMFNLGYLPGEDEKAKAIITRSDTTLPALDAALRMLRTDGVLTIVLYPGHDGGREECEAVEAWAADLPWPQYDVLHYRFANRGPAVPYLIAVGKRATG
jgi:SAM-dependent methyltransferase